MNLLKKQETEEVINIEEVMECRWNEQLDFFQAYISCWQKLTGFSYSVTPGGREKSIDWRDNSPRNYL